MIDKFIKYKDKFPKVKNTVFVAKGVVIIGDVEIDDNSNIWFNSVIRADVNFVKIGKNVTFKMAQLFMYHLTVFLLTEKKVIQQ